MAIRFDSSRFGEVIINGRPYGDVLLIGDQIEPRDDSRLEQELGSDHLIGDWEMERLLSNQPEIIIIATGTGGILRLTSAIKEKIKKAGVKLIIAVTLRAIVKYNQLAAKNKKLNALIHTTC